MKNQYYKMEKSGSYGYKPEPFSNFTMRVLFHIDNGKVPRRIIEIINTKGKKKTLDTETANLTSIGRFKEFIEGAGNYLFDGSAVELSKLKRKLFDEEKACRWIKTALLTIRMKAFISPPETKRMPIIAPFFPTKRSLNFSITRSISRNGQIYSIRYTVIRVWYRWYLG